MNIVVADRMIAPFATRLCLAQDRPAPTGDDRPQLRPVIARMREHCFQQSSGFGIRRRWHP